MTPEQWAKLKPGDTIYKKHTYESYEVVKAVEGGWEVTRTRTVTEPFLWTLKEEMGTKDDR